MIKLMFVVPYGGIEWKPTQHNNQLSYGKEKRGWFDHWTHYINGYGQVSVFFSVLTKQHS